MCELKPGSVQARQDAVGKSMALRDNHDLQQIGVSMTLEKYSRREILRQGALGALGLSFSFRRRSLEPREGRELNLYVGTYTSGKSEGIYIYRMNLNTGELKSLKAIKTINPSFLAIDGSKRNLYAVNEVSEFAGKSSGAVSAFAIDTKSGDLNFLNQQPSLGANPCHVIVDRTGRFVLVANYTGGSVAVLPILHDGSLGPATDLVQHKGSSVDRKRQEGPHAHCITPDGSNRYAFATDLGLDKILIYQFDANQGKLLPNREPWVRLKPGAGPRHFSFHPSGRFAYVINELNSTVTAFAYDPAAGTLMEIQTLSTLPKNYAGANSCAELVVSSSGRFLYGSNRGHNSIVSFAIDEHTGKLMHLEHVSTQGSTPRNFTIDPTGAFLLVANQDSDTIITFLVDPASGRLKSAPGVAEVPSPVCLVFA